MIDAMPIAAWDLRATPIPPHVPRSLRWYGPSGQLFHQRTPGTGQVVFTFENHHPASFVFQYTFDADDEYLDPHELRDVVKDRSYIN